MRGEGYREYEIITNSKNERGAIITDLTDLRE